MPHWWVANADRWLREKDSLEKVGIHYVVDERASAGQMTLKLVMDIGDQKLNLIANFPKDYPYFPPMVTAPELELVRHQTPGTKQLCLLERGGETWAPATDTLAQLLVDQIPKVFASQPDSGTDEVVEARQAEPITAFISTEQSSFIGFPAFGFQQLSAHGSFRMGAENLAPLRGTVLELFDEHGNSIVRSETRDADSYQGRAPVVGRWVRLAERPFCMDAKDFYEIAVNALRELQQPLWQALPGGARINLVALLFEDELKWRGKAGNVIFLSKLQKASKSGARAKIEAGVHRAELESKHNYFVRNPAASDLQKGTVAIAGLGSIGSPAAKLLAQSGLGNIRLLDQDVVEAGNAIRWEGGRSNAGLSKAMALAQLITANFPYTKTTFMQVRIGNPDPAAFASEKNLEEQLFRGVTCILDATASTSVNQYLSEKARSSGVPYVWMYATNGAWGGLVGVSGCEKSDFCWMCHLYYLDDGTIPVLPHAPEDRMVQPPGCLDPTFTGAQVDLTEVSLMATRMVIDQVLARVGE